MKKIFMYLIFFTILSCKKDISPLFEENKDGFEKLSQTIKKNNHYFFNKVSTPRLFLSTMFDKKYTELDETSELKSLTKKKYELIQKQLEKVGVYRFYITVEGNLFFNIETKDYFMSSRDYFIALLEIKNISFKNFGNFYIDEIKKIEKNWYRISCKSSPVN